MFNDLRDKLEGEIGERYKLIRSYRSGKNLNVYKACKLDNQKPRIHYVIKSYQTRDAFETESQMLEELKNEKNIMQMIEVYPQQAIIICECALYDLETFLGHQDYNQRRREERDIIKDVALGLLELQKHNIVHNELSPKNIMHFQEKDGYTERWKLIDFDAACFADKDDVKIVTNYSAPEVIRANAEGKKIKANFTMDMFSLGLVLYFIETGQHYWDGENEGEKEKIISTKYLPVPDVHDHSACCVIKKLLSKNISSRMTLQDFMKILYSTNDKDSGNDGDSRHKTIFDVNLHSEPMNIDSDNIESYYMSEMEFRLYQQKTFKIFLENYHNEMKESLKIMNSKIDCCTKALGDLTKKIPQWLIKVKNERIPRVFVMIPDQKEWKKPTKWLTSKPFRLLFVCEHKEQWHIPNQSGYKVLQVPQFIKKYGPWINLCLKALFGTVGLVASNIIPRCVIADVLSDVFNLVDDSDFMQYFQEIIDTVDICVKTIDDDRPDFKPLSSESNIPCKMINSTGLRELEKFIDTHESSDHLGGLVQCVDDQTQEILWLCKEHRDKYCLKETTKDIRNVPDDANTSNVSVRSVSNSPPSSSRVFSSSNPSTPPDLNLNNNRSPPKRLSLPISPVESIPLDAEDKLYRVDPLQLLEYVHKLLCEVMDNAEASGRKHFRIDDIRRIAQKMRGHVNNYKIICPIWYDETQKIKFINILESQVHLYIHFLRSIVRYCTVKDDFSPASISKQMAYLCSDVIEIKNIIRSGKSFNKHLSNLIAAFKSSRRDIYDYSSVKTVLDSFANESNLNVNIDDESSIISSNDLSQWYHIANQTCIASPTEDDNREGIFNTTKRFLKYTIVMEKSLKHLYNNDTYLCIEKEIYLYHEHHLNENDFIIKFHGYSIYNCKIMMFYDFADYGDLYTYFQVNHDPSGNLLKDWSVKIKLAWDISQGVKSLHDEKILHLDLRSANILLKYDITENGLMPKISNFLWSRDSCFDKTFLRPKIKISSKDKIWKRWYDPDRLLNEDCLFASSDIYSLGLLFWEIAWCKAENLPFKDIPIKNLYIHLTQKNQEEMPADIPPEYRRWSNVVSRMCNLKSGDRYDIVTVETIMGKLLKGRTSSSASGLSNISLITN